MIGTGRKVALDGAQLVTSHRMFDRETVLEPADPQARGGEVHIAWPHANCLADPQPMAIHHEQEEVVTRTMTAAPGGVQ
jgi:hypothetical protein